MMSPTTIEIATTAMDCFRVAFLSGQEIFLNSAFIPLKKLGFACFSVEFPMINPFSTSYLVSGETLFGFLVQSMRLTESAIFLGLHPVGMILLFLGRIVITLLALGTCQSYFSTHFATSTRLLRALLSHNLSIKKRPKILSRLTTITQAFSSVNCFFTDYWSLSAFFTILPAKNLCFFIITALVSSYIICYNQCNYIKVGQ